jgi:hypothetical protein
MRSIRRASDYRALLSGTRGYCQDRGITEQGIFKVNSKTVALEGFMGKKNPKYQAPNYK